MQIHFVIYQQTVDGRVGAASAKLAEASRCGDTPFVSNNKLHRHNFANVTIHIFTIRVIV